MPQVAGGNARHPDPSDHGCGARGSAGASPPPFAVMAGQPFRLETGGAIDRDALISFRFDGRVYQGFQGDTLASALLANGIRLVGRSFKYHRPRGIYTAGSEEPNALVTLRDGSRREPNTRATLVELHDGLSAYSQHAWPTLRFDLGAINGVLSALIPAGFYYKTFMGPPLSWHFFEPFIRRAAGFGAEIGRASCRDRVEVVGVAVTG